MVPQNEQCDSYRAAIDSFQKGENGEQPSKNEDMDSDMYDQLMDDEQQSKSENESLL